MEYRRTGSAALTVSVAGLGCNNFGGRLDADSSRRVIRHALERGVTIFDTADSYGTDGSSEILLGETLGTDRQRVVLATKFGFKLDERRYGASRRYIMEAVEASLRRLRTDWIDLYQMHVHDPQIPIEETLRALEELVAAGKVRFIGCSGLTPEQLVEAAEAADRLGAPRFVSCQDHYNMLAREPEAAVIPCLERLGMSLLPYAPLAAGLLSGKYRRGAMPAEGRLTKSRKVADRYLSEATWATLDTLTAYAEGKDRTLLELAIAWVASHPVVCSVIAGAMSPEQLDANIAAAEWRLSPAEIAEVDRLLG